MTRLTRDLLPIVTLRDSVALAFLVIALTDVLLNSTATAQSAPGNVQFTEHLIQDDYGYAYGISAADLDADGDLDLVSSDTVNNRLLWFENDGRGTFKRHEIMRDEPGWFERNAVGDVDGDGQPDVVVVKNQASEIVWFQNSGTPRDGRLWSRRVIATKFPRAYDIALADFDADSDLDCAASCWVGNQFAWFENNGSPLDGHEWSRHLVEDNIGETRTIAVADFNADGKPDLLGTARTGNLVAWYENAGDPRAQPWKKHVIDASSELPTHGHPVDLDGDGDLDVVMAFGLAGPGHGEAAWYENPGKTTKPALWKKHVIGDLPFGFETVAADLDGDGDLDVAATCWGDKPGGQVVWFQNSGQPRESWKRHILKEHWPRANQILTIDLDGDRRLDLVAVAERGSNELRWWRNVGPRPPR